MRFVKKFKIEIITAALIIAIYFLLRAPNLTLQPIFADEAIYIRWAQVMRAEPTLRFLPLSDGKTPLYMWVLIPLFKFFDDPLLAGRILSVLSGFATLLGVLFLGFKFFNSRVALLSAFLVAITPFVVFFDRMALVDSMLAAFTIWTLNVALLLMKYPRIDVAILLGYLLGGGILTKPPGFFNALVLPTTLLIFNWKTKDRQWKLLKILGLWVIAITTMFVLYNILRLGPGFSNLSGRNQDYIFSPYELVGRPLDPFLPHLNDVTDWVAKLVTIPITLFVLLGVGFAFYSKNLLAITIFAWALIPLLIEMAFLRTFTARYIFFSIPPLLFLGGLGFDRIVSYFKKRELFVIVILVGFVSILPAFFSYQLLTDPSKVNLPKNERRGYLEDWTAGYGFKEIAEFLINQTSKGIVVVGTEGSFGTLPDGLQIYLDKVSHTFPKDKQILVVGGKSGVSIQLKEAALTHPTYYVANKSRFYDIPANLILIKEYPKAKGDNLISDAILLFQVIPPKEMIPSGR